MTVSAGIDAGMETMKIVILKDEKILYRTIVPIGAESVSAVAERHLVQATKETGISLDELHCIGGTGANADDIPFIQKRLSETICSPLGIYWLFSQVHTVLDAGAGHFMVLKCKQGKTMKIVRGDKCASGVGISLRMASNVLGIQVQDMSQIARKSEEEVVITSTCSVFAESEIISLVHAKKKPEDIVKGVFRGLASRLYSLLLNIGIEDDVGMIGGMANCEGIVEMIEDMSGHKILVPSDPATVGALGAALAVLDGDKY
ncbi:acyl-CoA dehydratase activase [Chloroflexota bacterium]